ncbi:cell division protein FtsL [Peptoniphilus raoultii]|uniref:cell division protein FtsL n=1 Tax=Peptoniphilus raoultii TaxID=1776387 RepID=UPI0008D8EEA1|nr:cell division protein FtsL [Peptoniphilus raoultii]
MKNRLDNNKKSLKKRYNKRRGILKNKALILCLTIFVIAISAVTFMYSQNAALDRQILSTKSKIDELTKTKMTLIGDLKGIKSQIEVADIASYKLGMIYPDGSQIVYIDTEDKDIKQDVNYNVFLSPIVSVLRSFNNN